MPLTETQKKAYVEGGGLECPYCNRTDGVEGKSINVDAGGASQEIICNVCGLAWTDLYTLTEILEDE
jgi:transcription elongation factor Elf1